MQRRAYLFHHLSQIPIPGIFALAPRPLTINVAGVRFTLSTHSDELRKEWEGYFHEYRDTGPVAAEIFVEPLTGVPHSNIWHDEDPEFESRGDSVVQRDFAARRIQRQGDPLRVAAFINLQEVGDATHNLLRWVLPDLLLQAQCFLMHSASFVHRDQGYLFFGQSGAGKSTSVALVAANLSDAAILGDDAGIIGFDGENAWLHSAPLGSGYSRLAPPRKKILLNRLCALQQATHHAVEAMGKAEAVRALLASAMTPDFSRLCEERFDLATKLVLSPCGIKKLRFEKDFGFWRLLSANPSLAYNHKLGGETHVIR